MPTTLEAALDSGSQSSGEVEDDSDEVDSASEEPSELETKTAKPANIFKKSEEANLKCNLDNSDEPGGRANKAEATPWFTTKKSRVNDFQQVLDADDIGVAAKNENKYDFPPGVGEDESEDEGGEEDDEETSNDGLVVAERTSRKKTTSKLAEATPKAAKAKKKFHKKRYKFVDDEAVGEDDIDFVTSGEDQENESDRAMIVDSEDSISIHSDGSIAGGRTPAFNLIIRGREEECAAESREYTETRKRAIAKRRVVREQNLEKKGGKTKRVDDNSDDDSDYSVQHRGSDFVGQATRPKRKSKKTSFFRPPASFSASSSQDGQMITKNAKSKRAPREQEESNDETEEHEADEEENQMVVGETQRQNEKPVKKIKVDPLAIHTLDTDAERRLYLESCIRESFYGSPELVSSAIDVCLSISNLKRKLWDLKRVRTVQSIFLDGPSGCGKTTFMDIIAMACAYEGCVLHASGTMLDSMEAVTSIISGAPMGYIGCQAGTSLAGRFKQAKAQYPADALKILIIDEADKAATGVLAGLLEALAGKFYTQENELVVVDNLVVLLASNSGEEEVMRQTIESRNPNKSVEERVDAIDDTRVQSVSGRFFSQTQCPAINRRIMGTHLVFRPIQYRDGIEAQCGAIKTWTGRGLLGNLCIHGSVPAYFMKRSNPRTGIQMTINTLRAFLIRCTAKLGPHAIQENDIVLGIDSTGKASVRGLGGKPGGSQTNNLVMEHLPANSAHVTYETTGLFSRQWIQANLAKEETEEEEDTERAVDQVTLETHTTRKRKRIAGE